MTERIDILGCPVDVLTMETTVEKIAAAIAEQRKCQVVTANAEILYMAQHDPDLFLVLHDAGLVTADGMGVVWASRMLEHPLPERVAGCDLIHALAAYGQRAGWRFYILGAQPEVLATAIERLQTLYPHMLIVGSHHGYFGPEEDSFVVESINNSQADILLVAMGAPKQDKWLHDHLDKTEACVGVGLGGSLDVLAGTVKRAPVWMQRTGLEWLYRLLQQPSRFWRMLALPKFVWAVLCQRWRRQ